MKIKKSRLNIEYKRNIENIGDNFSWFDVKHIYDNYPEGINHYFYSDSGDPMIFTSDPFDIAICSKNLYIKYISFFCEKEDLLNKLENNIRYVEEGVLISDERFNDDNRHIDEKMEFNQYMEERNVYVIRKDAKEDLIGYRIDDEHYILFDEFDNFSGVVFKNLTDDQIYEMTKAKHPYWENIEIKDEVGENQKGE